MGRMIAGTYEDKHSLLGYHEAEKMVDKVINQALGAVKGEVENLEDM